MGRKKWPGTRERRTEKDKTLRVNHLKGRAVAEGENDGIERAQKTSRRGKSC